MYEFQKINQNILIEFTKIVEIVFKENKNIYLIKAIEYAIRKELPNQPKYVIEPIIRKAKIQLDRLKYRKIVPFESEEEAQLLFKERFKSYLDLADKNKLPKESIKVIYDSYDLCKYDKKLIFKDKEYLWNMNSLLINHRLHDKALKKWFKENDLKPEESNINISHNTNKGINDQLKFLTKTYNPYNNNPSANDSQKELEQHIIDELREDRPMMTRAISSIANVKFRIDDIKDEKSRVMIKSFKNLQPFINSDRPIDKKDIVDSWLTSIALLYLKINPQGIKSTTLGKYITTHAKNTNLYTNIKKEYIIPLEKLRTPQIRENGIYHNLRILEFTDNRRKLTYNEKNVREMENYIKNIIQYLKKLKL